MAARENNQNGLVHGGEAAVKAIQRGNELTGPAREAELQVYSELATDGRSSIVTRNAARLQAVSDLYFNAFCQSAEENDLIKMDLYVKRYGWLVQAALRAWAQVRDEEKTADDGSIEAAITSAKGEK